MVGEGTTVVIHFVGRTTMGEDAGEVFDTTDVDVALESGIYHDGWDYKPLEFEVGDGSIIEGVDRTVREMDVGETRTVTLEPPRAFGEYRESRVVEVPLADLEESSDVEARVDELVRDRTGRTGWITAIGEDVATVDFNHELAGESVEFEIRLLDANRPDGAG